MINLALLSRVINEPNVKSYLNVESQQELDTLKNHVNALFASGTVDENTRDFIFEYLNQQSEEKKFSESGSGNGYQDDYGDYPVEENEEDERNMNDFDDNVVVQTRK